MSVVSINRAIQLRAMGMALPFFLTPGAFHAASALPMQEASGPAGENQKTVSVSGHDQGDLSLGPSLIDWFADTEGSVSLIIELPEDKATLHYEDGTFCLHDGQGNVIAYGSVALFEEGSSDEIRAVVRVTDGESGISQLLSIWIPVTEPREDWGFASTNGLRDVPYPSGVRVQSPTPTDRTSEGNLLSILWGILDSVGLAGDLPWFSCYCEAAPPDMSCGSPNWGFFQETCCTCVYMTICRRILPTFPPSVVQWECPKADRYCTTWECTYDGDESAWQ